MASNFFSKGDLLVLVPGHFHAALVLKNMHPQLSSRVHVYAPEGPELQDFLNRINSFNNREQDPTCWELVLHVGPEPLDAMLRERAGNVVVIAGNNRYKTSYLKACVESGIHVLSDKPMCIDPAGWELLKAVFDVAKKKNVLLYDMMTERFEITSILQKALIQIPEVFGELQKGSHENPAVTKESLHHLCKTVSGKPLKRPSWYFDIAQQGEGIVDVTTHLVDLVMWACFPAQAIDYASDIRIQSARRWPTRVTQRQFERVTGLPQFPRYLENHVYEDAVLHCYCNGEVNFTLRDLHVRTSVVWNYEAPAGGGDTHESVMRGTKATVRVRQGEEQNYVPELYIEPADEFRLRDWENALDKAIVQIQNDYPGIEIERGVKGRQLVIPGRYRIGHEAHFAQVTERFLQFLQEGQMPEWEVANMIAKYYVTTQALQLARQG